MADDAEVRAERLGVAVLMFGLVAEPPRDAMRAAADAGLFTADERDVWRQGDDDDIALANACLAAERELRDAQWAALELLNLVRVAPGAHEPWTGSGEARPAGGGGAPAPAPETVRVPIADVERAAHFILGWDRPDPE